MLVQGAPARYQRNTAGGSRERNRNQLGEPAGRGLDVTQRAQVRDPLGGGLDVTVEDHRGGAEPRAMGSGDAFDPPVDVDIAGGDESPDALAQHLDAGTGDGVDARLPHRGQSSLESEA